MDIFKIKPEYIPDKDYLYRRIHPAHYVASENRPQSAAFRGINAYECSVEWEKHTTPEKSLKRYRSFRHHFLAKLQALVPRQVNQKVVHTPRIRNPSHADIVGQKTLSVARHLAKNSEMVIVKKKRV